MRRNSTTCMRPSVTCSTLPAQGPETACLYQRRGRCQSSSKILRSGSHKGGGMSAVIGTRNAGEAGKYDRELRFQQPSATHSRPQLPGANTRTKRFDINVLGLGTKSPKSTAPERNRRSEREFRASQGGPGQHPFQEPCETLRTFADVQTGERFPPAEGGVGKGTHVQPSLGTGIVRYQWLDIVPTIFAPKITHAWPQKRFLVKHPRWEPSALVAPAWICQGGAR